MDRDTELEIIRRAYAKQIMAAARVSNRRIEAAFASVKREDFLGRGPRQIGALGRSYVPTPRMISRRPAVLRILASESAGGPGKAERTHRNPLVRDGA